MSDVVKVEARRADGKFAKGNKWGKGNPHQQRIQKLKSALLETVDSDDLKAIMAKMIQMAKAGDVLAAKLVFDRVLGKAPLDIQSVVISDNGEVFTCINRPRRQLLD